MRNNDQIPKEFQQHLTPMPANVLHEFDPAFIFMDADPLEAERQAIVDALPKPAWPSLKTISEDEANVVSNRFSALFQSGDVPSPVELSCALALLSPSNIELVQVRMVQIRRAIWHARHYQGRDFDRTRVFAVPPVWRRRWESLIAGNLRPAYVAHLGVGQFS